MFYPEKAMTRIFFAAALLLLLAAPSVSTRDFKPVLGNWKGTLTYLDYTSGKPYTMPANITVSINAQNSKQLILAIEYPNEPKANGNDTLTISSDGKMMDRDMVISKQKSKGILEVITERNDVDGNEKKKALIRHIYSVSKKMFTNRKEVKFEGEEKWILRNEYKMSR